MGPTPRFGLHHVSCLPLSTTTNVPQVALAFLNDSCASTHGSICVSSIFISPSGEWKLGGLELLSNSKDEAPVLYVRDGVLCLEGVIIPIAFTDHGWTLPKHIKLGIPRSQKGGLVCD